MTIILTISLILAAASGVVVSRLLNTTISRARPRLEPSSAHLQPSRSPRVWVGDGRRKAAVVLLTPITFVGVAWLFLADANASSVNEALSVAITVLAFIYLAAVSIALTFIDLATHRLPNSIVMPCYPVGVALLGGASLFVGDWQATLTAAAGMVILFSFYFMLRYLQPAGMGGGDVKLAGVIGMYLGWLGWTTLAVGAFSAFLLGGVFGVVLLLLGRAKRTTALPFGPWMLAGAWVGIVVGEAFETCCIGLPIAR